MIARCLTAGLWIAVALLLIGDLAARVSNAGAPRIVPNLTAQKFELVDRSGHVTADLANNGDVPAIHMVNRQDGTSIALILSPDGNPALTLENAASYPAFAVAASDESALLMSGQPSGVTSLMLFAELDSSCGLSVRDPHTNIRLVLGTGAWPPRTLDSRSGPAILLVDHNPAKRAVLWQGGVFSSPAKPHAKAR